MKGESLLKRPFRALGAAVITVILLVFAFSPIGAEEGGTGNDIRLFLRCGNIDGEVLELEVCIESDSGVCAMICDVEYDSERYIYLSGGATDEGVGFKAVDFGSTVSFVIDSVENTFQDGVLAKLYFKRISDGRAKFTLISRDDAIYLGASSDILSSRVQVVSGECVLGGNPDSGGGTGEIYEPRLIDVNVSSNAIAFWVEAPRGCFAAGVRLFFVDLSSGEYSEVFVLGVVGGGLFSGEYRHAPNGSYAVVITALGYGAREVRAGEKRVEICN